MYKIRSQNIKGTPSMSAKRVRHDLENVINSCSAAGLQEMKWAWYWVVLIRLCKREHWGRYPRVFKGAASAQVLIWNRREWRVKRSWTRLLHGAVPGVCQVRFMRAVWLVNKQTGEQFILKTTHYLPNRGGKARFERIWTLANQRDCAFVEFLADLGVPVVSTGDYNKRGDVFDDVDNEYSTDYSGLRGIDFAAVTQKAGRKQVTKGLKSVAHGPHLETDHDGRILTLDLS